MAPSHGFMLVAGKECYAFGAYGLPALDPLITRMKEIIEDKPELRYTLVAIAVVFSSEYYIQYHKGLTLAEIIAESEAEDANILSVFGLYDTP